LKYPAIQKHYEIIKKQASPLIGNWALPIFDSPKFKCG